MEAASETFRLFGLWCVQDIAPSLAHLGTGSQQHPQVLVTQLPAGHQSGGAPASNWLTPQWFESPSHLLHLGGTTGSKVKDPSGSGMFLNHHPQKTKL